MRNSSKRWEKYGFIQIATRNGYEEFLVIILWVFYYRCFLQLKKWHSGRLNINCLPLRYPMRWTQKSLGAQKYTQLLIRRENVLESLQITWTFCLLFMFCGLCFSFFFSCKGFGWMLFRLKRLSQLQEINLSQPSSQCSNLFYKTQTECLKVKISTWLHLWKIYKILCSY